MAKFRARICGTLYYSRDVEVEARNEDEASGALDLLAQDVTWTDEDLIDFGRIDIGTPKLIEGEEEWDEDDDPNGPVTVRFWSPPKELG